MKSVNRKQRRACKEGGREGGEGGREGDREGRQEGRDGRCWEGREGGKQMAICGFIVFLSLVSFLNKFSLHTIFLQGR
jgi:hypothetical protein